MFEGYFPRAGVYRAWTQFLRRDQITTFSFTFRVPTLEDTDAPGGVTAEMAAPGARRTLTFLLCAVSVAIALLWPRDASPHLSVTTRLRFNKEIAPMINAKCAQCHAPDGMAMPLQTWDQTRPWAVAIKEEILSRHMPPWPAERGYGAFANDGALTSRELEFLVTWIDGGVPMGEGAHSLLRSSRSLDDGNPPHVANPDPTAAPQEKYRRIDTVDPRSAVGGGHLDQSGFDFKTGDPMLRGVLYRARNGSIRWRMDAMVDVVAVAERRRHQSARWAAALPLIWSVSPLH